MPVPVNCGYTSGVRLRIDIVRGAVFVRRSPLMTPSPGCAAPMAAARALPAVSSRRCSRRLSPQLDRARCAACCLRALARAERGIEAPAVRRGVEQVRRAPDPRASAGRPVLLQRRRRRRPALRRRNRKGVAQALCGDGRRGPAAPPHGLRHLRPRHPSVCVCVGVGWGGSALSPSASELSVVTRYLAPSRRAGISESSA